MKELIHLHKTFEKVVYTGQKVSSREFENCVFKDCDFSNTAFLTCTFMDCEFIDCNLSMLDLSGSNLKNITFKNVTIEKVGTPFSIENVNNLNFIDTYINGELVKNTNN